MARLCSESPKPSFECSNVPPFSALHPSIPVSKSPFLMRLTVAALEVVTPATIVAPSAAVAIIPSNLRDLGCRLPIRLIERSEEHTSELQSRGHLVCRLLLEK